MAYFKTFTTVDTVYKNTVLSTHVPSFLTPFTTDATDLDIGKDAYGALKLDGMQEIDQRCFVLATKQARRTQRPAGT